MSKHQRFYILGLLILLLMLSACSPEAEVLPTDMVEDDPVVEEVVTEEPEIEQDPGGSATIDYEIGFYLGGINGRAVGDIPVSIELDPTQDDSYLVSGSNIIEGQLKIIRNYGENWCSVVCSYPILYSVEGQLTHTPAGDCQISVIFLRDFSIGPTKSGTCSDLIKEEVDCSEFRVFGDDSTYHFTGDEPVDGVDPLDAIPGPRQARIRNVVLPEAMKGICEWY